MNVIFEQGGFDPSKFDINKAKQSINTNTTDPSKTPTDAGKPKPDAVNPKPDAGKPRDTGKPTDIVKPKPDAVKPKPDTGKPDTGKHGGYVDNIQRDIANKAIQLMVVNGIQFYTSLYTALSYYDIPESAVQKLFSTHLKDKQHAQYCDMIIRIGTGGSNKLNASIKQNIKKYNYFISRNKTSTSVEYLNSFRSPATKVTWEIKSFRDLFNANSEFYDYVWEGDQFDIKTKNILAAKGIIEYKGNDIYTVPAYTMTDEYIIKLVTTIYDYKLYGAPKSNLK